MTAADLDDPNPIATLLRKAVGVYTAGLRDHLVNITVTDCRGLHLDVSASHEGASCAERVTVDEEITAKRIMAGEIEDVATDIRDALDIAVGRVRDGLVAAATARLRQDRADGLAGDWTADGRWWRWSTAARLQLMLEAGLSLGTAMDWLSLNPELEDQWRGWLTENPDLVTAATALLAEFVEPS